MVVGLLVWIASLFGYVITDVESAQEAKDIRYRQAGPTLAIGGSFRHEDQGGISSIINAGYEANVSSYGSRWGYHAFVRAYMGTSEFALIGISNDLTGTDEKDASINDISVPVGVIYNVTDTLGVYVDIAPYMKEVIEFRVFELPQHTPLE